MLRIICKTINDKMFFAMVISYHVLKINIKLNYGNIKIKCQKALRAAVSVPTYLYFVFLVFLFKLCSFTVIK